MISSDQAERLRGSEVRGADGKRIGSLEQVYLHGATGMPTWASVRTGLLGMYQSFVPLADATFTGRVVHLPYDRDTVKGAPSITTHGTLSSEDQVDLQAYYDRVPVAADPGPVAWSNEPSGGPESAGAFEDHSSTTSYDDPAAREAWDASTSEPASDEGDDGAAASDELGGPPVADEAAGGEAVAAEPGDVESVADEPSSAVHQDGSKASVDQPVTSADDAEPRHVDEAMTRSEEHLEVGVEEHETGRAHLHKYVVTEEQTVTVPVTREEVRVEREPIEGDEAVQLAGEPIGEGEVEVVLHAEQPVVSVESQPVERVRLAVDEVTSEESVTREVRTEQIDFADSTATPVDDESSEGETRHS